MLLWYPIQELVLINCVGEECTPLIQSYRLLYHSNFRDSFGRVEDASSKNTQEAISLGSSLMWNGVDICGGRRGVEIWVRDLSER